MIRTPQRTHAIAVRIAEVLRDKGEDWVEEVLRLIGGAYAAAPQLQPARRRVARDRRNPSRMEMRTA